MIADPFALEMERLGPAPSSARFENQWEDEPPSNERADKEPTWDSPDLSLLGTGQRAAPSFPLPLLGPWAEWAEQKAAGASAPIDYCAVALLACAGAALGNVRWPLAGADWSEPPLLWCAVVGPPSSSKSPSMDAAFALVRYAEDQMALGFETEQLAYTMKKQVSEACQEEWKAKIKAAVKKGDPPPPMPDEAQAPDLPVRPRIRVADATVEALGGLAAALPRGLLLVRDELAGWLGAFDRYGGGGSDRAFAIEMYGGRSYVVDRVKSPLPLHIRHLAIGLLGGVQPDKLPLIISGPDDGLASRLLWTWPDARPEFVLARNLQDDTLAKRNFARLSDLPMSTDEFGHAEPRLVRLTSQAEDVLEAFAREMVHRGHEAGGLLAGTIGKARGHVLRLSCVLEYLWWCGGTRAAEPTCISKKAVEAAAGLLDGYFLPMAERVYGDAAIPIRERRAMLLVRYLRRTGQRAFNARQVRREHGGMLRDATDMQAACAELAEACLIQPVLRPAGEQQGRPALNYEVNPAVLRGQR
ncbi:DUF3987 domain-containing protein [Methylobacterium durans]|uniref:DUF3987 domain-containing protein n=1 Tax=Methylobacterium durans TaxID=2202825 RepID=A0A2U8W4G7_9HYPH|nr:DUF3987 domain-containing protein [Methylobacterium durans]AWN40262.1 hypothetical protein DK389_06580 [Methylobacterium durans]